MLLAVLTPRLTWDSLVQELGSSGRLNFFWEPMAAGKGGAENMAATTLMRVIHECICSGFLGRKAKAQRSSKRHHLCHGQRELPCIRSVPPSSGPWPAIAPGALPVVTWAIMSPLEWEEEELSKAQHTQWLPFLLERARPGQSNVAPMSIPPTPSVI